MATVLLFVGIVSGTMAISHATKMSSQSSENETAALLAQQRFATIEADPTQLTSGDQQGDFGDDYPSFHWRQETESTDITDLLRVTVVIEIGLGSEQRQLQFVSYEQTADQ